MAHAPDFPSLFKVLSRHEVEMVVVGGVAATLAGAPIATFDLDIVHHRTDENIERLLAALQDLDAIYRDPGGRVIRPNESHLRSPGHQLLLTRYGPLDVLGTVGEGLSYPQLIERSTLHEVGGLKLWILDLAAVIELKEQAGRDKDRAVLPVLRRTLDLRED